MNIMGVLLSGGKYQNIPCSIISTIGDKIFCQK